MTPNKLNHRKHSKRQRDTYNAFRNKLPDDLKWLIPVIFNKRTGNLIDGHLRVEEAIKNDEDTIPVRVVDCDESMEAFILEYFDSIGQLATVDQQALSSLHELSKDTVGAITNKTNKILAQLHKDMQALGKEPAIKRAASVRVKQTETEPSSDEHYTPAEEDSLVEESFINNEVKFDSSNKFDLPDLLPEYLATPDILPTITYNRSTETCVPHAYFCESTRPFKDKPEVGGTLGFFTEDWRFERAYNDGDLFAATLREERWSAVCTPDFSTYATWPLPIQLFNLYRSRWCGRLWQELGIPIIPTIQYMGARTYEYVVDTLPNKCPTVALQTRKYSGTQTKDFSKLIQLIQYIVLNCSTKAILIYGNPSIAKYTLGHLPKRVKYIWLEEFTTARRKPKRRTPNN